jgi:hypothetical protein
LAVFILVLVLGIIVFLKTYIHLPQSEFKMNFFMWLHNSEYEKLFEIADKYGFSEVRWSNPKFYSGLKRGAKAAWRRDENNMHRKVDNPDLDEFIEFASQTDIAIITILKYNGRWAMVKGFSIQDNGKIIHGHYEFGALPVEPSCQSTDIDESAKGNCSRHLFGQWYLIKYWYSIGG